MFMPSPHSSGMVFLLQKKVHFFASTSRNFIEFILVSQSETFFFVYLFVYLFIGLFIGFYWFIYLLVYLFIYLWMACWVFISVRGLSLVAASGGHSSSRCAGLSLSQPLLSWSTGSRHTGPAIVAHGPSRSTSRGIRSEERRVGKECRSRWSPYH